MEHKIDLHFHSKYSEGAFTVDELLTQAKKFGFTVLSLTDHNVIEGVPEILAKAPNYGIKAISGVELYTKYQNIGFHLLGYNFDHTNKKLVEVMHELQTDNENKIKKSINNLKAEGFIIDEHRIFNLPAKNYGAVHILEEMEKEEKNVERIKKDLPTQHDDFFVKIEKYFGNDKPGQFTLSELPTDEAIKLIELAGGFSSLAHPGQQISFKYDNIIVNLKQHGLRAIEVLSPYHNWHQIEHYQEIALTYKLLITGGSDFHGDIDFSKNELLSRQWNYFHVPYNIYEELKNKIPNL
ncbi:MAG: PHP domain-containing protein [bacterium]|nr:PHP domain-containing protein [bacterium]